MRTLSLYTRSLTLACLASGLLLTTGCKREADQVAPTDVVSAEDHGSSDEEMAFSSDLLTVATPQDETVTGSPAVAGAAELGRLLGTCATRSYNADTRTLVIDFGPTNCLCPDGRYRRGKIVVVFTGSDRRQHSGAIVSRENYFVNDNQHTATRIFTNLGNGSFTVDVPATPPASIIFANNGGTHTWTGHRVYTRTAGYGTPQLADDEYSITGTTSGTNRRGVSYTATIVQPLIKRFTPGCFRHFVSGTVSIVNSKGNTLLLNYDPAGTGTCDNIASVTVNGGTPRTITLR
ncbi:hypothetical protein IC235_14705 [Hymenobacter sp. BT664]|uniref:Lipoprotein n=1 Tax=Hymenobacter montanus TaxID=2771359 RepID=A0A927BFN4_9BACT|nr:hypothetical protein [Hymenobacter montanus]MBD2769142.1 hypothetical protein [Hymenobacter montanus]